MKLRNRVQPVVNVALRAALFGAAAFSIGLAAAPALPAEDGGEWWLNTFFQVEGEWQPAGEVEEGWAPRAYDSEQECQARESFSEAQCGRVELRHPAIWSCSADEPLTAPPPDQRANEC